MRNFCQTQLYNAREGYNLSPKRSIMLKNFVKIFGGDPNKKTIEQYSGIAQQINALEPQFEALSDDALRAKTDEFRAQLTESVGNQEGLDEKEQFKAQQDALDE